VWSNSQSSRSRLPIRRDDLDQCYAPKSFVEYQVERLLDDQQRVPTKYVQKAGQQRVGDLAHRAADTHNPDLHLVGGGVDPARVAAPQNTDAFLLAVRTPIWTHTLDPADELRGIVFKGTWKVTFDGHVGDDASTQDGRIITNPVEWTQKTKWSSPEVGVAGSTSVTGG